MSFLKCLQGGSAAHTITAIRDQPGNPVLKWVESIKPWISGDEASGGTQMGNGEDEASGGDIIARAKG